MHLHFHTEADSSGTHVLCCCAAFLCFLLCAGCLFKDRVWHSHGIWCLCDCIKRMCGMWQRWTGTNPAAALHRAAPCSPPTSAELGKCLQCSLETCHPSLTLQVFLFFYIHSWLCPMKSNTFSDSLIFSNWEVLLFTWNVKKVQLVMKEKEAGPPPSPSSLCSLPSRSAHQHLPLWQAVIE